MPANKEFSNAEINYERLGYWEPLTLGQQLRVWSERYQNSVALVEGDSKLTYLELDRKVDELASATLYGKYPFFVGSGAV